MAVPMTPPVTPPLTPPIAPITRPYTPAIDPYPGDGAADAEALRKKAQQINRGATRAAVLGVNDGLVSNLCLILGVAGASASQSSVRIAGFASLIAGACSMAAGEWISVQSQVDMYNGVVGELRRLTQRNPLVVLTALIDRIVESGVERTSASKLASELPLDEERFFSFSAKTIFGVDPDDQGSPLVAAGSSLSFFAVGAIVPLAPWFLTSGGAGVIWSIVLTAMASLIVGGFVGRSSDSSVTKAAIRQFLIVLVVAALTFGIGKAFGTAIG
jgi:vacuolar iron transporter family protein